MAVTVTQIDGQNVGLRLLAQTSVSALSLNLTTGVVTSTYLSAETCSILREFALKLFLTVPASARAGAAIGLLQRLCAVSPADASALTLNALVTGGVATLVATIASSPGTLILTTPYAQMGGVMFASGGGGSTPSPPTPSGDDTNLLEVPCFQVPVGTIVRIDSDSGDAEPADCTDIDFMPAVGVVEEIVDATHAKVRIGGRFSGFSGLTPGKIYFVGEDGELTITPPIISGHIVQPFGFSLTETTIAVTPCTALSMR